MNLPALIFLTLLNSLWLLPVAIPTALAAAYFTRGTPGPTARPMVQPRALFAAAIAWPLVPLLWATAFGVDSPRTPVSPWHMRLLAAFVVVHTILSVLSVLRAPRQGRTRQIVAVSAVASWWIGVAATILASMEFGAAPL